MDVSVFPASMLLVVVAGIASLFYSINYFVSPHHHPDEPPVVSSPIPLIGHIIGLVRHGTRYYEHISSKCKLPIFTMNVLNGKIYVITSPSLVNAVNRNSKVLAFNPLIAQVGKRITGHDEATSRIVQHNLNGENGTGYVIDIHDAIVSVLAPGKSLTSMTAAMLREATPHIEKLQDQVVGFFAWTRQMVTLVSTTATYGPQNPFNKDPDVMTTQFWEFDRDLDKLIVDIAPAHLAPKGYRARAEMSAQFERYYDEGSGNATEASEYAKARYTISNKYGITPQNQGRLEVGALLGVLANTIPSTFYMLAHIYADKTLLKDVRTELEATSVSTENSIDSQTRCLRILTMRDKCLLLNSVFSEMLRLHALGSGARYVREDIRLDGQWLLKKGMVVQMPQAVLHSDRAQWGPGVHEFQPRRFLGKSKGPAYRPFGGGSNLCPGRFFVRLEIMALAACLVLRYDIDPADGSLWCIPKQKNVSLATNVFPPEKDVRVKVSERKGCEGVTWKFDMT